MLSANEAFAAYALAAKANDLKASRRHWAAFLVAHAGIYTKLEQGAKCCASCVASRAGWYGKVKKLRKDDPLLRYLHHARNSEEHSLADVSKFAPQGMKLDLKPGCDIGFPFFISEFKFAHQGEEQPEPVRISVSGPDGAPVDITYQFDQQYTDHRFALAEVRNDRYGDRFPPPFEHLGTRIKDISPDGIGRLGLDYAVALIAAAKARVCRP